MGGIALFTLSSRACGLAPNAVSLDIARCVQGMGAAFVLANAMPLIAQVYDGQARNMAIAVWGTHSGPAVPSPRSSAVSSWTSPSGATSS
ncbi:hypothetical protein ABZ953_09900 [Streptomyces sp. NPDC046465]|uniref:hypothetical protein n=1 Tax=Streptomyces sp. NPDC046465 TaxID=3155810 RepID=UPI0033C62DFE